MDAELNPNHEQQAQQITALLGGKAEPEKKEADVEATPDPEQPGLDTQNQEVAPKDPAPDAPADPEPDSPEPGDQEVIEDDDSPPTLTDLAETLELSEKDLYGVEVPMRGVDERVTLGDLKDTWRKHQVLTEEREQYDVKREQQTNEMMIADRQLNQFIDIAKSTGHLTPEVLTKLNELHSNNIAQQQRSLMISIPSWQDPQTRANDFEKMVTFAAKYGYTRANINNTADARHIKVLYDAMKAQNLVSDARRKQPAPTNIKKGARIIKPKGNTALNAKIKAAKSGGIQQKTEAISALLNTS